MLEITQRLQFHSHRHRRPSGICFLKFSVTSSGMPLLMPTSMKPGAMALTVMFCRANSRAETFVRAMIAALLEE